MTTPTTVPIHWAPSAAIIVRDPTAVQFGVDATRSGVITTRCARRVATALRRIRTPQPRSCYEDNLVAAGMDPVEAALILDDLLAHGVLIPKREAPIVTVIGATPLARRIAELLGEAGLRTQQELVRPSELVISTTAATASLGAIDRLVSETPHILPVSLRDGLGYVGPLRRDRRGPCPACLQLHESDRDPRWMSIMTQAPRRDVDATSLVVTAAATAAVAQSALGWEQSPPGMPAVDASPGLFLILDPHAITVEQYHMRRHRLCPICMP